MLRVDYLAVPGLPTLSFEVAVGECLAVEGPSGSGKTRMLRALADLDPAGGQGASIFPRVPGSIGCFLLWRSTMVI